MTEKGVTKRQAEKVLSAVKRLWPAESKEGTGPTISDHFDWYSSRPRYAIVWEEGPHEWARAAASGPCCRADHPGIDPKFDGIRIDGVFIECETSWALGLYPNV